MLLKSRHVLQCSKTQYWRPVHFERFPQGQLGTRIGFHMLNVKTRLLTNHGMLKILCLEVEKLLKWISSNCLHDDLTTAKGDTHACYATYIVLAPSHIHPSSDSSVP